MRYAYVVRSSHQHAEEHSKRGLLWPMETLLDGVALDRNVAQDVAALQLHALLVGQMQQTGKQRGTALSRPTTPPVSRCRGCRHRERQGGRAMSRRAIDSTRKQSASGEQNCRLHAFSSCSSMSYPSPSRDANIPRRVETSDRLEEKHRDIICARRAIQQAMFLKRFRHDSSLHSGARASRELTQNIQARDCRQSKRFSC